MPINDLTYDVFYNTGPGYGAPNSHRSPLSREIDGEYGVVTFDYPSDKIITIRLDAPAEEGEYFIDSLTFGQKFFGVPFIFPIHTMHSQKLLKLLKPANHISSVSLKNSMYAIQVTGNDPIMEISNLQDVYAGANPAKLNMGKYISYVCVLLLLLSYYAYYHTNWTGQSWHVRIVIRSAWVASSIFSLFLAVLVYFHTVAPYLFMKIDQWRKLFDLPKISDTEFAIGWIHHVGYSKSYDFVAAYLIILSPIAIAILIRLFYKIESDEK